MKGHIAAGGPGTLLVPFGFNKGDRVRLGEARKGP